RGVGKQRVPERAQRLAVHGCGENAAEDSKQKGVDVEQSCDDHQREESRHHEVLDRIDAEHLQRVELLADLTSAEVRSDRRSSHPDNDHSSDTRAYFANGGKYKEPSET